MYFLFLISIIFLLEGRGGLDRLTWRHDSILNFIAKSLQPVINVHSSLYADVNGFLNPLIITGENYCPDPSWSKDGERYPADKSLSSG